MITLIFSVYILAIVLLDLMWGLVLPAWLMISMVVNFGLVAWIEYNNEIRGVWTWLRSRFSFRQS